MTGFKQQFTKIKDLSDRRRMPRLGRIRLGIKKKSARTGNEYPTEVSYFVCPPEVVAVYGEQPTMLDIMFPVNDIEVVFPQAYKHYGKSRGLKCTGNLEQAMEVGEDGELHARTCPCEKMDKECNKKGHLMVILPKVNVGGLYQIDVGSYNSIIDINSGIDYVGALMQESLGVYRFAMIPLVLKREPRETHHDGKKQIHYTLKVHANVTIEQINHMKSSALIVSPEKIAIAPPEDRNPELDPPDVIVHDEEDDEPSQGSTPNSPSVSTEDQAKDFLGLQQQLTKLAADKEVKDFTGRKCTAIINTGLRMKDEQGYTAAIQYYQDELAAIEKGG